MDIEDFLRKKYYSIKTKKEKLAFCDMLEEITFELKTDLESKK